MNRRADSGVRLGGAHRAVVRQPAAHIGNPFRDVRVRCAVGDAAVVVQLEVIVRVDETWQHDRALQIDDGVAALRRRAHVEDSRAKSD